MMLRYTGSRQSGALLVSCLPSSGLGNNRPSPHTKQYLSCAAESIEEPEHRTDRLLDPPIGIDLHLPCALPAEPDRHADSQLTAARLRDQRVDQSASHHSQLELAHRALQAEQQTVVRQARIVDTIRIEHSSSKEPAQLKEMMPIAAIAGKSRSFKTENCADIALAEFA
jgi:hypothetical protein